MEDTASADDVVEFIPSFNYLAQYRTLTWPSLIHNFENLTFKIFILLDYREAVPPKNDAVCNGENSLSL